ncbi:MAG TPA: alpha/beta fold hydrolase [Solirubrobacteraceae bacterium]
MAHTRTDVTIPSGADELAAWLHRPEPAADARIPCIVMAHGFSATRADALPAYAERFADAGFGVVLFDYRGFGDSGGAPRQVIDIRRQQEDYEAAIRFAARQSWVDPERIALFGSSFSGGHVVDVASRDQRIAAVIAQAPFADGLAQLRHTPPKVAARGTLDGLRDLLAAARGRAPVMIRPAGAPGSYAVMTAPEAEPGFAGIVASDSRWQNAVGARIMLFVGAWRPVVKARAVTAPLLVCVCDADETTPPAPAVQMALNAPRGEVVHYPIGHFDIYTGADFERAITDQLAFLERVLTPATVGAPA